MEVYSDNREDGYDMDAPFDRRFLYINVQQQPDDSLLWYVRYLSNVGSLMNSAIAFQCEDDYVVLPEHIADLDVLSLWDQDGFSKGDSLTHLFVTTNGGSGLYQSIEHSLARQVQTLTLACKEVPQGDSLGWVIRTQLSDDRVFLDTLTFSLQ